MLGLGLMTFGVTGLLLLLVTAMLLLGSLRSIGDAASGFERQRTEILAMLDPAASALSDAADSAAHAGSSLTAASDASRRGADLTSRLATSFESMAGLGAVDIFGTRPFAGVTAGFSDVAAQSRALSVDLASTADALATNVTDSQAVSTDLHSLADRLAQLEAELRASGGVTTSSGPPILAVELLFLALLLWLAVPAVASLWLGWRLTRGPLPNLDARG
jgi:hypothetical protein